MKEPFVEYSNPQFINDLRRSNPHPLFSSFRQPLPAFPG